MIIRTATEADWPKIMLLGTVSFGMSKHPDSMAAWRSLLPTDGALVACDGDDIVGMSMYLDFQLTVPGGATLPVAGVSGVAVAPTHRRRGLLRDMLTELHRRASAVEYPLAGLTASEGGIYGRFGYGPATYKQEFTVDRRFARLHADAPNPGGVRLVNPAEQLDRFAEIYDRWQRRTPGGLARPRALWEDLLADREETRDGGSQWFSFHHEDGYALYRMHGGEVRIGEFVAVTPQAHAALWRALLGLDLMERIVIATHPGDPLPYLLTDPRLPRTSAYLDDLWLRFLDLPAALEARSYAADLRTVIDVRDDSFGGGGRFVVDIRDGRARCTPTDAPADLEMDVDVLAALYMGGGHVNAFCAANRLRVADPTAARRFGAAFVSEVPAELGYRF